MNRNTVQFSFLSSLPVMAGYVTLGMGFGIILADKGYSFWWALLMSLTIYAGSMQYVGVGLLSSGTTVISTALMTLMVNARHLFYGISMLEKYKNTGAAKPYLIFSLTDETYSLVCNPKLPKDVNRNGYYLLVSVLNQIYWLFGSLLGGILGNVLPGAIIAMLVVYCLKDISFISKPYGLPQIVSVLFVVLLHKWKHNTLLSIFAGTVCYMLLIQFVMQI